MGAIGTYVVTIGSSLGFDARAVGNAMAASVPFTLLGPVTAHIVGERAGLLRPLVFGLALLALDLLLLVDARSPAVLGVCTVIPGGAMGFCTSYAIALLGRLDGSGRAASATPAFMMLGIAVGPALGGVLIDASGFQTLAAVAASFVAVGILLLAVAAQMLPVEESDHAAG